MLKKFRQLMNKDEKGFTLVELLAVIVILGIIAAIAIPSIANVVENSKKDAVIRSAEQMVEAYRTMNSLEESVGNTAKSYQDLVDGGYLEKNSEITDGKVTPQTDDNDIVTGYNVTITTNDYTISSMDVDSITRANVTKAVSGG